MDMNCSHRALRAFASKVTALSADQLALWRGKRPRAAPPSSGERSEQRWEGEGGSLGTPKKRPMKA
jgi:hypothetical protein